jgi:hypothetical protein
MCRAEDQELSERRAVPSSNMASNSALAIASRSGASRLGRQVTGGPGIVRMWWTVLWPFLGVQTCAATDVRRVSFPVGDRRRAAYTFVPGFCIGDGVTLSRDGDLLYERRFVELEALELERTRSSLA